MNPVTNIRLLIHVVLLAASMSLLVGCNKPGSGPQASANAVPKRMELNRGKHFVMIMGCNDCHTPGYAESNGTLPESQWLTGSNVGWHGPWGTTYASNLRKLVQGMSQDDWIKLLRDAKMRPPMPAYAFKTLQDQELGYIYTYIHSLGTAGGDVPAYLPPGKMPPVPYVDFVMPPQSAAKAERH